MLAAYERRLLEHKIGQLRSEFIRRFNQLARKAEFVSDVRIHPETFAVTLIDRDGQRSAEGSLSAGEKQIYAIAMLWALARTSGRPLPMIIDTPLARLDSEHRSNLIERYFPARAIKSCCFRRIPRSMFGCCMRSAERLAHLSSGL